MVWRDRPDTGSMSGVSQAYPLMAFRQQADALAKAGDLGQARALLEDVVADARIRLGEDDPDVLATAHHLAVLHREADDPAAARRVLEEAYAAGQWRIGDADPLMLEISFDLGMVAAELGNLHEARKALMRVAEIGAEVLGADHWAVQQARNYLDKDPSTVRAEEASGLAGDAYPAIPAQRAPHGGMAPPPVEEQAAESAPPAALTDRPPATKAPPDAPTDRPPRKIAPPAALSDGSPAEAAPPAAPTDGPAAKTIPPATPTNGPAAKTAPPAALSDGSPAEAASSAALTDGPRAGAVPMDGEQSGAGPLDATDPAGRGTYRPAYQIRGSMIFAAVAASLAVIVAVAALFFALDQDQSNSKDNVPTLTGRPPTNVRLVDHGASIRLTWGDPAGGRTTFLVTGGHPGDHLLKPMGQTGPGETAYELQGLSTELDYCFAVVAVYGASAFASSPQVCTDRVRPRSTH